MLITLAIKVATYQIIVLPRASQEPHPIAKCSCVCTLIVPQRPLLARLRPLPVLLQPGRPALHPSQAPLARRAASRAPAQRHLHCQRRQSAARTTVKPSQAWPHGPPLTPAYWMLLTDLGTDWLNSLSVAARRRRAHFKVR
ncbi:hypothetical protein NN561_014674 [Cricetulus griseus]